MLYLFDIYNKADFFIKRFHVDPEFEFMKDQMKQLDIELALDQDSDERKPDINVMAAQEHVSDIERAICVIKERYRCLWHQLLFKAMPRIMIQEAAKHVVKWLNAFPPKGGYQQSTFQE